MISLMKFLGGDKISRRKFLATPDHSYFPMQHIYTTDNKDLSS